MRPWSGVQSGAVRVAPYGASYVVRVGRRPRTLTPMNRLQPVSAASEPLCSRAERAWIYTSGSASPTLSWRQDRVLAAPLPHYRAS